MSIDNDPYYEQAKRELSEVFGPLIDMNSVGCQLMIDENTMMTLIEDPAGESKAIARFTNMDTGVNLTMNHRAFLNLLMILQTGAVPVELYNEVMALTPNTKVHPKKEIN
jgi:hypothetical protein